MLVQWEVWVNMCVCTFVLACMNCIAYTYMCMHKYVYTHVIHIYICITLAPSIYICMFEGAISPDFIVGWELKDARMDCWEFRARSCMELCSGLRNEFNPVPSICFLGNQPQCEHSLSRKLVLLECDECMGWGGASCNLEGENSQVIVRRQKNRGRQWTLRKSLMEMRSWLLGRSSCFS